MKKKLAPSEYVYVASMLFGMFFGAGNLIFPVYMGQMAGSHLWSASLGFFITGVGLPLLGLVPEDAEVVLAAAQGTALIFAAEDGAAEACLRISRRLRGDYIPLMKL